MRIWFARQKWTALAALLLAIVTMACNACLQESLQTHGESGPNSKGMKVYIELTGDAKLSRRFLAFLDLAFEGKGISRATTSFGADVVVKGNLTAQKQKTNLGLGLVRMQITYEAKQTSKDSCASIGTNPGGELFEHAAKKAAEEIRKAYPKAQTVRLDPASDMKTSDSFGNELPVYLKTSDFNVVKSGPADLLLHIELVRQDVPLEEETVKYEFTVSGDERTSLRSTNGTGRTSVKRQGDELHVPCPERLANFDWLTDNDPLFIAARDLTRGLLEQESEPVDPSKKLASSLVPAGMRRQ